LVITLRTLPKFDTTLLSTVRPSMQQGATARLLFASSRNILRFFFCWETDFEILLDLQKLVLYRASFYNAVVGGNDYFTERERCSGRRLRSAARSPSTDMVLQCLCLIMIMLSCLWAQLPCTHVASAARELARLSRLRCKLLDNNGWLPSGSSPDFRGSHGRTSGSSISFWLKQKKSLW
jgi:hypothetical protein